MKTVRISWDWIQKSDRWIMREYNNEGKLVGINFCQGEESIDSGSEWKNDKWLYCALYIMIGDAIHRIPLNQLDAKLWDCLELRSISGDEAYMENYYYSFWS